jgi:hypothetical protein
MGFFWRGFDACERPFKATLRCLFLNGTHDAAQAEYDRLAALDASPGTY